MEISDIAHVSLTVGDSNEALFQQLLHSPLKATHRHNPRAQSGVPIGRRGGAFSMPPDRANVNLLTLCGNDCNNGSLMFLGYRPAVSYDRARYRDRP
jgi:hypothetical protein